MIATTGTTLEYRGKAAGILPELLSAIDGTANILEVAKRIGAEGSLELVTGLCQQLVDDGVVTNLSDRSAMHPHSTDDYLLWSVIADDRDEPAESWESVVNVIGTDKQVAATERMLPPSWPLQRTNLSDLVAGESYDCWTIVWSAHMNAQDLQIWNERAYDLNLRWLPISDFDGYAAVVGPLIYPPDTPCYECYRRRRAANSALGNKFLELAPVGGTVIANSALIHLLASLAVLQLQSWSVQEDAHVPGAITAVTFNDGLQVRREYVMRVPRCTSCRPIAASTRETPWTEAIDPSRGARET